MKYKLIFLLIFLNVAFSIYSAEHKTNTKFLKSLQINSLSHLERENLIQYLLLQIKSINAAKNKKQEEHFKNKTDAIKLHGKLDQKLQDLIYNIMIACALPGSQSHCRKKMLKILIYVKNL